MNDVFRSRNRLTLAFFVALASSAVNAAYIAERFETNCPDHVLSARFDAIRKGPPIVGMIDRASSGQFLPDAFRTLGFQVLNIHSAPQEEQPEWYKDMGKPDVVHRGNLAETVADLKSRGVQLVTHGTDKASKFGTELAHGLGVPNVDVEMSEILRNKYFQNRFLAHLGIPVPDTLATGRLERMLKWQDKRGIYPVVVKPMDSSGSDGVHICYTRQQIIDAFNALHLQRNTDGNINRYIIIQEFMEGTEVVVNFVSSAGVHLLTDFWQYVKLPVQLEGGAKAHIRSHNELIPLSRADEAAVRYCIRILNAFKYWFGASHFEIMLTAQGPRLVELNPRLAGARLPQYVHEAGGWHPAALTAEALGRPDLFQKRLTMAAPAYRPGRLIRLISNQTGRLAQVKNLEKIEALPSFSSHAIKPIGTNFEPTRDLKSCPGQVFLEEKPGLPPGQLDIDMAKLREIEPTLFVLEEAAQK